MTAVARPADAPRGWREGPRDPRRGSRASLRAALAALASAGALPAAAQQVELAGIADVMAGVEGGGTDYATGVRRTRTTVRAGLEGWATSAPAHVPAVGVRVEVEPTGSFGADLRYQLRPVDVLTLHAGLTSVLVPETLLGGTFGLGFRPMLSDHLGLYVGPTVEVWALGSDLPAGTVVLWQIHVEGGLRVAF